MPVAPVLHVIVELQLLAVNITAVPAHTLLVDATTVGVCFGVTTISFVAEAVHVPVPHVAVYVVVAEGLTVMLAVVAPVLHVKPVVHPVAVKVVLSPTQITAFVAIITGAGVFVTFTAMLVEPVQVPVPHVAV